MEIIGQLHVPAALPP